MTCQSAVPIITSMAVLFAGTIFPGADTLNGSMPVATLRMSPAFATPTIGGMEYYRVDDPAWLPGTIPVAYAQKGNELGAFATRTAALKVGNGLSPFTDFTIDLNTNDPSRPKWQLPPAVDEVMLVLTVQWTNVPAPGLTWLPQCMPRP